MRDLRKALINALPECPDKRIIWITYDIKTIRLVQSLFIELRGKDYYYKYVTILPKGERNKPKGRIYFDPCLGDLLNAA